MAEEDRSHLARNNKFPDEREKYEYFWGSQSVFSRWYQCDFVDDGKKFSCIEEYLMYQKAGML